MKKKSIASLLVLSTIITYAIGSGLINNLPEIFDNAFKIQTSPIITLKGKSSVNLIVGDEYIDEGVVIDDEADIIDVSTDGAVNIYIPGTYTITYTAEDTAGTKTEITRIVIVESLDTVLPFDTNLYYAPVNEKGYLYFADPQPSENGKNRVIRVNYETMEFDEDSDSIELTEDAYLLEGEVYSNPHSVDRAGKTNKFYVRTQNSYSFDVIAVEDNTLTYVKTIPLSTYIDGTEVKYSPRAFGAYNAKYNIQLLSGRNTSSKHTMIGIVDVETDEVIKHINRPIDGNGSSTTGHAKWLDRDHFAVIDRGNHSINTYKVFKNDEGELDTLYTGTIDTVTPIHAIERVKKPKSKIDLNTFYIMGESADINGTKTHPFIRKLTFNTQTGKFNAIQLNDTSTSCDSTTSCGTSTSCDSTTSCGTSASCDSTTSCGTSTSCDSTTSCGTTPSCSTTQFHASETALFIDTDYDSLKEKNIPATTHHVNITPDEKYIIVPVYDGRIYKVDRVSMEINATLDTGIEKGLGAAHIEFSSSLNIAIVTNHWSPYITIIDISNNEFKIKGYAKIYRDGQYDQHDPDEKHLMQPHFAQVSKDGKYFYTFASQDNGRFIRMNLEELLKLEVDDEKIFQFENNDDDTEVMKSIDVEGAPEQAHS